MILFITDISSVDITDVKIQKWEEQKFGNIYILRQHKKGREAQKLKK